MDELQTIQGGFILVARKILDSDLLEESPLVVKLWIWLLLRANWKDRGQLDRGQLVTTIIEIQEAMSHYSGWRKIVPTKDEIRSAYGALSRATRITTRKTSRGMVISIVNYDTYQNSAAYASPTGTQMVNATCPSATPHHTEEGNNKNNKPPPLEDGFAQFWSLYPRKVAKASAQKAWTKLKPPLDLVLESLSWQVDSDQWKKDGGQFVPYPATWLNAECWNDEPVTNTAKGGWEANVR